MKNLNTLPFYITIILVLISISYGMSSTPTTQKTISSNKTSFEKQIKKFSYFKQEILDRYILYHTENKNLSPEQIVTHVNIGLDNPYYTNTKEATNLNTTIILVNKYNYLKKDYIPNNLETINEKYAKKNMQLVKEAKEAFEKMAEDAAKENLKIIAMSTYRSYEYQKTLYDNYVTQDGKEKADTYSARAGYSEHQTGLAVDIFNGDLPYTRFEETQEFIWMKDNAHKYGFILRYPKDKTYETGYEYESWHYRYVGKKIAKYIKKNDITYDEYYIKKLDTKN